jgi:hypothetical protein
MVNKVRVSGIADMQSQKMAYINTYASLLCVCVCVCVCISFWVLFACLLFILFASRSILVRFIFFPSSSLIYFLLSPFLFSIRSVFCYVYEHTYFVFSYSVCTHLPLICFTNTLILFHDFSLSCFQMQQFLHGFQNENETFFSFLSLL